MILNRRIWLPEDGDSFISFLEQFRRKEKEEWSRKILNTKLDVLAIPTKTIHYITDEIMKGNYQSFLNLKLFRSYESIAIFGLIVSRISDFRELSYYLDIYLDVMENWAHCDLLSLRITDENKDKFLAISDKYLDDKRPLVRRLSLMILFQMIKNPSILDTVFHHLKILQYEEDYYVIMMAGWLLSECIILYEEITLEFIRKEETLNRKIVNKGIQKCRESRRLSMKEKDYLLRFKR